MTGGELQRVGVVETQRKSPLRRWALACGAAVLLAAILGIVIFFVVQRMTAEPEQVVQANSMFFKVTDMSFNQRSVDQAGAELAGTVTLESGTEVPANFKLVRERGSWKLLGYHIGS